MSRILAFQIIIILSTISLGACRIIPSIGSKSAYHPPLPTSYTEQKETQYVNPTSIVESTTVFSDINIVGESKITGFQVLLPKEVPSGFHLEYFGSRATEKINQTTYPPSFGFRLKNIDGLDIEHSQVKLTKDTKPRIVDIARSPDIIIFRRVNIVNKTGVFYGYRNDLDKNGLSTRNSLIWEDSVRKMYISANRKTASQDMLVEIAESFYK